MKMGTRLFSFLVSRDERAMPSGSAAPLLISRGGKLNKVGGREKSGVEDC